MDTAQCLEKTRQLDFEPIKSEPITQYKAEVEVVRSLVVGKYYEATYLTSTTGIWPKEKHFSTKPREYVGQYIRHRKEGMGDSADHWYIFLLNNEEIEVELDFEGTRAFYEVSPRE